MTVYDHQEPKPGLLPDAESLSTMFAKIITSEHNQHAIVMIVGPGGSGKSWTGLKLASEIAKKVSEIKGGEPEQYYNLHDTLAVINKDEIKRVMDNAKQYNIIHLDDIGVGWNARKYKDEFNIYLNDIIQTFRPNNNVLILTLQASFLIDKVPRSLVHYFIEMDQKIFDKGISIAKVFRVVLKQRSGKIFYEYIQEGGMKYLRYEFSQPDKKISNEYEKIRATQLKRMHEIQEKEKEELASKQSAKTVLKPVVEYLKSTGLNQTEIGDICNISQGWVSQILHDSITKNVV